MEDLLAVRKRSWDSPRRGCLAVSVTGAAATWAGWPGADSQGPRHRGPGVGRLRPCPHPASHLECELTESLMQGLGF